LHTCREGVILNYLLARKTIKNRLLLADACKEICETYPLQWVCQLASDRREEAMQSKDVPQEFNKNEMQAPFTYRNGTLIPWEEVENAIDTKYPFADLSGKNPLCALNPNIHAHRSVIERGKPRKDYDECIKQLTETKKSAEKAALICAKKIGKSLIPMINSLNFDTSRVETYFRTTTTHPELPPCTL
jgi:hypothetical protein